MSEPIHSNDAPSPAGHYSQGVRAGSLLFVSGQLAITPAGERSTGAVEEQTTQALRNVLAIVQAAGGALTDIVKTTVYIPDVAFWGRVNATYAEFFGAHKPARAIVPSRELHHGLLVEIEAIAELGGGP
ncbi:MAG: Rid family detoxifying hydrolase [Planctomycetota bacterium]